MYLVTNIFVDVTLVIPSKPFKSRKNFLSLEIILNCSSVKMKFLCPTQIVLSSMYNLLDLKQLKLLKMF